MFKKKNNDIMPELPNNRENSEVICARIRQEAQDAVDNVMANAEREASRIMDDARNAAQKSRQDALNEADKQIQKEKERSASSLNLEKKRLILNGRDKFAQAVFGKVAEYAGKFRDDRPGYEKFLEKTAVEGILALGLAEPVINYAAGDEAFFNPAFLKKLEDRCRQATGKDCPLKAQKGDFNDPGVVISSPDGRLTFDNRLFTRFSRIKEKVYMSLLKEAQ